MTARPAILTGAVAALAISALSVTASAALPNLSTKDHWVWYEDSSYPMSCVDGSPTGIGYFMPSTWNGKVLFWLDGGGFCFDAQSCNVDAPLNPIVGAALFSDANGPAFGFGTPFTKPPSTQAPFTLRIKYGVTDFNADTTDPPFPGLNIDGNGAGWFRAPLNRGIFDRTNPAPPAATNPFRQYLTVFIPYCTADLHIGSRVDVSSTLPGRQPAGGSPLTPSGGVNDNFQGLQNALNSFTAVLTAARSANDGRVPSRVVLAGASAGGFGADYLYSALRGMPQTAGARITTISDSGMPLFTGTSGNGVTWDAPTSSTGPGYFGAAYASPATVTTMEESMWDAYGAAWASFVPATAYDGLPMLRAPLHDGRSFVPMQVLERTLVKNASVAGSPTFGDRFAIIDSASDWDYFVLTPLTMVNSVAGPHIGDAEAQLLAAVGPSVFYQVTNTATTSGPLPWTRHHAFMIDDLSVWGSGGSGLGAFLNTLGL